MLNGKYGETWSTREHTGHDTPWNWPGGSADRVRDRVRRWWRARSTGLEHRGTRERQELEQNLQCVECGDRFFAPPGTLRCTSCSDQEW